MESVAAAHLLCCYHKCLPMKFCLPVFICILFITNGYSQKNFYPKRWSDVYEYEVRGLPWSALYVVDTIYGRAKREKNITQFTKALLYQSKFALTLEENAELKIVKKLQGDIHESKAPLRNILESILATIYWQYFKEHRSTYYNRTTTSVKANPEDFRTWDARAILEEIHQHFQNSLLRASDIQGIRLESIDEILVLAEGSKKYRPTLYDLLANNALDFYVTNEGSITKPANRFIIDQEAYFSAFENQSLASVDTLSASLQALKIFKDLLVFHKRRNDTAAYVNVELDRLKYIRAHGHFEDGKALYRQSVSELQRRYRRHAVSTLADFELALLLHEEGNTYTPKKPIHQFKKREAVALCEQAMARFPLSDGAARCRVLSDHILTKQLFLKGEEYVSVQRPSRILVNYTNMDSLYFSVYRVTETSEVSFKAQNDSARLATLLSLKPEAAWHVQLSDLQDYQGHSTEVVVPPLPAGRFLIVATTLRAPGVDSPLYGYAVTQVTDLAFVESDGDYTSRFQVVNRNNGKPVGHADIHLKTLRLYANVQPIDEHLTTDKDGFAVFKKRDEFYWTARMIVTTADDSAVFDDESFSGGYRRNEDDEEVTTEAKTFMFTDRSIYRPGQPVYFKGILLKTRAGKSTVVAGEYVKVILEDAHGKDIETRSLKTNAYGSFSGEFSLPAAGLTGTYSLYANEPDDDDSKFYDDIDDFDHEEADFSVEEYKRPTFEASFNPLKGTYKLNDSILVRGNAVAFNASKISKAKVSFRVKRQVRYPRYYWHGGNDAYSAGEEIAHGTVETDGEGGFSIGFRAIPDDDVPQERMPVFAYSISVDVTDINGETRSASTTVKVGYHSMVATIEAPRQIDVMAPEQTMSIRTENLNGQFLAAKGTLMIYKLQGPSSPVRKRPWEAPDQAMLTREEFEHLFPNDTYENLPVPAQWQKGRLLRELAFNTAQSREVKYNTDASWEPGRYSAELTTTDSTGQPVKDSCLFEVTNAKSKRVADNALLVFQTDKTSYKAGEVVRLRVGSASSDAYFTIDIERDHKITKTYLEHFSGNSKEILIPVPETKENGFLIHCTGVLYNSFLYEKATLYIEEVTRKIEIETQTFKDKLQPGEKETWSFTITGDDAMPLQAEVLASMYDASLDQFKQHAWQFDPVEHPSYYSRYQVRGAMSFGIVGFILQNLRSRYWSIPPKNYDQFDWFGFTLDNDYYTKRQYLNRLYYSVKSTGKASKVNVRNSAGVQDGYITGTITSGEEGPLPGVNVVIKGTTRGTTTDANGAYRIEASKDDVVTYSFIGYVTAEVAVGKKNTIDIQLEPDLMQLSEVVVIGYGTQEKRMLTGSVSVVNGSSLESSRVSSLTALQGRMPGVQVSQADDGGALSLRIRGQGSIMGNNTPLYIVDGVIADAMTLDESDITTIELLKDASATALYGARGANGVVIITTKSGQHKLDEALSKIRAREDFKETAFFFPHLSTNSNGAIRFTFTTPESLTRWKLQLLAHTKDLLTKTQTLQAVTQKDLMVTPNPPRFLRVGDEIILSAKIANLSRKGLSGRVMLQLLDAATGLAADERFGNMIRNQSFTMEASGNTEVSWRLKIPVGIDAVQYRIVAKAGNFSDGEQNILPVLSNRMLVTETMPLYVRSSQTKTFMLEKLKTQRSSSLQHHQLTVEITSNPAWYALQALPYLMEYPHECAEQMFSRYYANALASHVVNSSPKIKEVFSQWSSVGKLLSNLEKNESLKSVIIEETPWMRDAETEAEQKKRIGLLFDLNTMTGQLTEVMNTLQNMQQADGGFPWFAGSAHSNRYITQHIASGYGHLKHLGVGTPAIPDNMIEQAVAYLDAWIVRDYNEVFGSNKHYQGFKATDDIVKLSLSHMNRQYIGSNQIHYLYMRSFYKDIKPSERTAEAIRYYSDQAGRYWQDFNFYTQGMIALIHFRSGDRKLSADIIRSLKEYALASDELGMYWKENAGGWYWYEAPVETQSLLIEAFAEIQAGDPTLTTEERQKTLDEMRLWLLKNKQTTSWKTTKATTEAVYALLLNGTDWLTTDVDAEVTIGGQKVIPDAGTPEAGTGYFKTSWKGESITPAMGTVTFTKKDKGIAWGGVYWQYFEDLDKITPAETPLKLTKKLYAVRDTDHGKLLKPLDGEVVKPGDLVRVRIELTSDRDMEFLHMKDMRAAGLEPVDVLSAYKWREGLGYYQSTRDAATNFFFDYMPKGTYVFEYDLRANNRGDFSNGITTIQSMYAPEFSSHSEGVRIVVR